MTSILSNLKKRFSIKPTTISDIVNNNDDESEIKQLNINSNNNNSNNVNSQLKKVYKRKKSSTVDSDDDDKSNQSSVDDDEDDNNSSEDSGQEIENVKGKSVTFKEQPKPNNMMANKQLSAVPKSKRKSIIIQPTNLNQTNIDTTTIRNDLDNNSLPPIQKKVPLTHLQISEIYANCIKLSTENVITFILLLL